MSTLKHRKHSIAIAGGIVDQDYTGEIKLMLTDNSNKIYDVTAAQKIAQLLVIPCRCMPTEWVKNLEETNRGANGFGSSGTHAMTYGEVCMCLHLGEEAGVTVETLE